MIKLISKEFFYITKEELIMAIKATAKKPLFGNRRSHALNATRHAQKLNLQNVTLEDGTKIKVTAREAKKYKKNTNVNEELNENED